MRSRIQNETKSWVAKTQREQLNTQNIFSENHVITIQNKIIREKEKPKRVTEIKREWAFFIEKKERYCI